MINKKILRTILFGIIVTTIITTLVFMLFCFVIVLWTINKQILLFGSIFVMFVVIAAIVAVLYNDC